jgi:hypothetical protein
MIAELHSVELHSKIPICSCEVARYLEVERELGVFALSSFGI